MAPNLVGFKAGVESEPVVKFKAVGDDVPFEGRRDIPISVAGRIIESGEAGVANARLSADTISRRTRRCITKLDAPNNASLLGKS